MPVKKKVLKFFYSLDIKRNIFHNSNMEDLKKLIEQLGGKKKTAEKLMISVRYIDMILAGTKVPSKQLQKLIQIFLT